MDPISGDPRDLSQLTEKLFLTRVAPDGNCLFHAMVAVLRSIGITTTVDALRSVVAASVSQEQFAVYRDAYHASRTAPGAFADYAFMGGAHGGGLSSLSEMRAAMAKGTSYWGDELALAAVEASYDLCFVVLTGRGEALSVLHRFMAKGVSKRTHAAILHLEHKHYKLVLAATPDGFAALWPAGSLEDVIPLKEGLLAMRFGR